jgi:hypothetical protein
MENDFKDIAGYEGLYQINKIGLIKSSYNTGKCDFIRMVKDRRGYYMAGLTKDGTQKKIFLHRLIAIAFIPNSEGKPCINHIDGNKTNNSIENLEWCTWSENNQHAIRTGLFNPNKKKRIK